MENVGALEVAPRWVVWVSGEAAGGTCGAEAA